MPLSHPTADLFCKIVDNYGDAAIGWRLACALARDHGFAVRLYTDDLTPFAALCPAIKPDVPSQTVEGVTISGPEVVPTSPANLVIEVLAGTVPDPYLQAMAAYEKKLGDRDRLREPQQTRPIWILYEYLSAEGWVEGTHLKPSPHPRLPLTKYFFYPGFTTQTGGLLGTAYPDATPYHPGKLRLSLFGYENDRIAALIPLWVQSAQPIEVDVPSGRLLTSINAALGKDLKTGDIYGAGNLTLRVVPFAPLDDYIAGRQTYDLNFVRGEDSLTIGVLSGRPLVWQIYPQDEDTHIIKLRAFLDRYTAGLPERAARAVTNLNLAWNGVGDITAAWQDYILDFARISEAARDFAAQMRENGDAAQNLVDFYRQKG